MPFSPETTGYVKTALSDLQGAWENLKDTVLEHYGFPESDRLMFHIHEAMSWESVRNLDTMKKTLVLITNIAQQTNTPDDVLFWISEVQQSYQDVVEAIADGTAQ